MIAGVSSQAQYRLGDILANAITHGVGAAFALAGAVVLIVRAARGSAWLIVSCSIYAATLVLVYVCSTLTTRWCGRARGMSSMCWTTRRSTC